MPLWHPLGAESSPLSRSSVRSNVNFMLIYVFYVSLFPHWCGGPYFASDWSGGIHAWQQTYWPERKDTELSLKDGISESWKQDVSQCCFTMCCLQNRLSLRWHHSPLTLILIKFQKPDAKGHFVFPCLCSQHTITAESDLSDFLRKVETVNPPQKKKNTVVSEPIKPRAKDWKR